MTRFQANLTPEQFEIAVQEIVQSQGAQLDDFKVARREVLPGTDGEYEIDVTARFEALGASFLVLIECKYHKSPIKREVVQVLHDRLRSVGAQKGILVATSHFQSGAVLYAEKHGIALVLLTDGSFGYVRKADIANVLQPGTYVANIARLGENREGGEPRVTYTVLSQDRDQTFFKSLGLIYMKVRDAQPGPCNGRLTAPLRGITLCGGRHEREILGTV
ncbi:MAG TPA: restriction endonuclease [Thermoanaerobaculia bacterium]|jgi:restriction system protein|nr:restriction endonuclease [Thermoanaerobaculia bacterium]